MDRVFSSGRVKGAKPERLKTPASAAPVIGRAGLGERGRAHCSCGGGCPRCQGLQAKMRIGGSSDRAEAEADAVAERVVTMSTPSAGSFAMAGRDPVLAELAIQRSSREPMGASTLSPEQRAGLSQLRREGGAPLSTSLRAYMEPRFGHDFSDLRLHTGAGAGALADSLGARAFASGRDLVFGPGEFRPSTQAGKRLIAHELTHAIQQRGHRGGEAPIQRKQSNRTSRQKGGGPALGRVYRSVRDLLRIRCMNEAAFRSLMDGHFTPGASPCRRSQSPRRGSCSYSAFIVGETHNAGVEHDFALRMVRHLLHRYRGRRTAPTFHEEMTGGSSQRGIFSGGFRSAQARPSQTPTSVFRRYRVTPQGVPPGQQYQANRWAPGLVRGSEPAIIYVGNAHTSRAYHRRMGRLLPNLYSSSAGPPVLETIQRAGRRGLVLTMESTDSFLRDAEIQAYRERLRRNPSDAVFQRWLTAFQRAWTTMTRGLTGTCIRRLGPDVYFALIGAYSGLQYANLMRTVWADPRMGGRFRREGRWELYGVHGNRVRFRDTRRGHRHFLQGELQQQGGTSRMGNIQEQNY